MIELAILVVGVLGAILGLRARVTITMALVLQSGLRLLGLSTLARTEQAEWSTFWWFAASVASLVAGYTFAVRRQGGSAREPRLSAVPERRIWLTVLLVGALALYHLVAVGPPLLSDSVERARFDFTSSGLFGIPGRMYLFGTTMTWILATCNAKALNRPLSRYGPWLVATAIHVVCSILSGFKGGMLSLVVTLFGTAVVVTGYRISLLQALRRYWVAAVAAVAYFIAVASLFPTYERYELSDALTSRMTVGSAEPVAIALEGRTIVPLGNALIVDWEYFSRKYTGRGTDGLAATERIVGAVTNGANPFADAWVPPVTVSGFAEIAASFGVLIGILVLAIAGYYLGAADTRPGRTLFSTFSRAVVVWALYSWILKGGTVYHILNFGFVFAVVALLGCVANRPSVKFEGNLAPA